MAGQSGAGFFGRAGDFPSIRANPGLRTGVCFCSEAHFMASSISRLGSGRSHRRAASVRRRWASAWGTFRHRWNAQRPIQRWMPSPAGGGDSRSTVSQGGSFLLVFMATNEVAALADSNCWGGEAGHHLGADRLPKSLWSNPFVPAQARQVQAGWPSMKESMLSRSTTRMVPIVRLLILRCPISW